jgi:hypothetical protein
MPISWEELSSSPEYLGLDKQNKAYAKAGWFKSTIGPTPEFQDLTEEEKMKVIKGFFADEMQEAKMPDPEEVRKKMMEQSKEDAGVLEQIMPAITRGIDQIGVAVGGVMEAANLPYGTAIKNLYKERGERPEIQKPAYLQEGNVWTNKERLADPVFWTNLIFENAPMMASIMAPGFGALRFGKAAGMTAEATKKLALGGAATGAFVIESGSAYEDAREEMLRMGYDETTATNIARVEGGVVGLVNAMLEVAPFHLLIKNPGAKKGLSRVVRQAFAEGGTEAVQENVNMIVAELGHKPDREFDEWMGRTIESALGGFVLGGGVGAVYGGDGFDPASDIPKKGGDVLGDLEGGAELTPPNIETVKKDAFELGGDLAKYNPTDSELKEAVKKAKDKDPQAMTDDIRREAAARKAEKDGNLALAAQIRRQVRIKEDEKYREDWREELAVFDEFTDQQLAVENELKRLRLTPEQRQAEILKYFPDIYGTETRPKTYINEVDDKQQALEIMNLKGMLKTDLKPAAKSAMMDRLDELNRMSERERVDDVNQTLDAILKGKPTPQEVIDRHPPVWTKIVENLATYAANRNPAVLEIRDANERYRQMRQIAEQAGMLKEFLQVNLDESVHNGVRWQTIKAEREINSAVAEVASITKEDVDRAKAHIKATLNNLKKQGRGGNLSLEAEQDRSVGLTLEDVQTVFPNERVAPITIEFQDGKSQGFVVELANGKRLYIDATRSNITFDLDYVAAKYNMDPNQLLAMIKNGEAFVKGKYRNIGDGGLIELIKTADLGTLTHEKLHALFDLVLTEKEKAAILGRYGTEEKAAEAFRRREGFTRSYWDKIKAFLEKMRNALFGDVFNMEAISGQPKSIHNDLIKISRYIYAMGYNTPREFAARLQDTLGYAYSAVQNQVEELYNKAKSLGPSGFPALDILKAQAMSNMGGIELDYDSQNILRQVATANSIQGDPVQPEQYEPAWLNPHHKASLARIAPETKLALQKEAARFNATLIGVQDGYGSIPTRYMLHDNETNSSGMLVEDPAEIQNAVIESRENFYKLADEAVQLKKDFDSKGPTISDPHWGDKGSSELFNDLIYHGAQLIDSGVKTFKQFRESFVYHYEGIMADISKFIKRIWDLLKNNLGAVGNLVAQKSASPWYSQLSYFANQKLPGKSSPKEYANILNSWAKKGLISRSELEWSGVVDWLNEQKGKVSKQELVDWLDANGVKVEEVEKVTGPSHANKSSFNYEISEIGKFTYIGTYDEAKAAWGRGARVGIVAPDSGERIAVADTNYTFEEAFEHSMEMAGEEMVYGDFPKFNRPELLLPGGTNYRELLLTLPKSEDNTTKNMTVVEHTEGGFYIADRSTLTIVEDGFATRSAAEAWIDDKRLKAAGYPYEYTGTHYDEPNILAHVRFNEREVNGKRVLFIEEIQSDWHQEGRKKGYKRPDIESRLSKLKAERDKLMEDNFDAEGFERGTPEFKLAAALFIKDSKIRGRLRSVMEEISDLENNLTHGEVPNAPFKKSWPLLAFKRMVRYASENGYDSIAWTPGEVQAERYDLSKHIDEVETQKMYNGDIVVMAYKDGHSVIEKDVAPADLSNVVGKELADKILNFHEKNPNTGTRSPHGLFSGIDLKVGGEGMIGFYDKIIPAAVNKFFNKPAWGKAKVGVVKIETEQRGMGDEFANLPMEQEVWNLPLNDTIRMKSITQGMPLFGAGIPNMPTGGVLPVLNNQRGELNIDFKAIIGSIPKIYNKAHTAVHSKKGGDITAEDIDTTHIDKDRLGFVERYASSPQWLAKRWVDFKSLFEKQLDRLQEKSERLYETLEELKGFFGLNPKETADTSELANGLRGIQVVKDSPPIYFDEDGNIHQNEEHYPKLRTWLDGNSKTTDAVKDAYVALRRSFDKDLIAVWNWLNSIPDVEQTAIDEFRNAIGMVHNYFPHIRYGKYNITIKNTAGDTVYRKHFNAPSKHVADTHAAYILNNDPYLQPILEEEDIAYPEGKKFKAELNEELPEDAFSIPVPIEALEAIINAAVKKVDSKMKVDSKEKEKLLSAFKDILPRSVAEVMQSRGWGAHLKKARGIEGFERTNIKKVVFDYKTGLYGWLTKMKASREFADVMYNVDAEKDPQLWSAMRQFTYDMLRNDDKVDRVANNMRAIFFVKYLGFNMKTAALNLTQNMILGWPRLSMEVGGSFGKTLNAMNKVSVDWLSGKVGKASNLDPFQQKLLLELHGQGDTQSQFINEIRGQLGRNTRSFANQTMRLFAAPMAMAERFNRTSIALAAFDSIRNGKIDNPVTLARLGIERGQKLDMNNAEHYELAKEFAREIVTDAHFLYGKSNRPEAMRGGAIARGAATAYTFRTFSHNLLQAWAHMWRNGGRGKRAIMRSLAATIALGGMSSIPFYKTFMHLMRQLTGEDWDEKAKDLVLDEDQDMLRNLMTYGVPSLAGVNIGGSLGMEVPILDKASFNESLVDQLFQGTAELIGIPAAILQDSADAVSFARGGQFGRAAEKVLPAALAFPIKARRLRQEGMRTRSGGPVNFPDDRGKVTEPYKISGSQMAGQFIGFTPVVNAQLWDTNQKIKDLQIYRNIKQGAFADDVIRGIIDGDKAKLLRVQKEIMEYNRKQLEKGNSYAAITKKSFRSALSARSKGMSTPLYLAPLAIELRKKYTGK